MLCIDIQDTCIIMRDQTGGQLVRLFFNKSTDLPVYDYLKPILKPPFICINRLVVSPLYQNNGLGTLVMNLLFDSNPEIRNYIVTAKPDEFTETNEKRLYSFYGKFGFKPFKESEDGLIMLSISNI